MKELIKVFKALSDPNRIKILKLLEIKPMCVCELKEALGVSQPAVSKHLRVLEDANLVDFKKDGMWVNYFLKTESPNTYARAILNELKSWINQDPEIVHLKNIAPSLNREEIKRRQNKVECKC